MRVWGFYNALNPSMHLLLVGLALVVVAALVNRFAPDRRPRLRRALTLYLIYALATVLAVVPSLASSPWVGVAHELLEAFTLVHLGAIAIFELVLPALRIGLSALTTDLMLGGGYILTAFAVLTASGVEVGSFMAASTVVAAILTFSLQNTLGNVLGGLTVLLDGSVKAGDWLRISGGREGRVLYVRWRHTLIETRDGDTIVVPNATLLAEAFTILGRRAGEDCPHRMWVYFNVDFRHAPAEVCRVVVEALRASPIPNVVADPPPDAICLDLAREGRESYGYYAVRYWLADLGPDEPTSSLVRSRVHAALRRNGIPMARPSYTQFSVPLDEETDAGRAERRRLKAANTLRRLDLFSALTDDEVEHLSHDVHYAPFAQGETITRQGAVAHFLYILHRGRVDVRLSQEAGETSVSTLEAPGFFGEMGLMTGEPRQASVIALSDVICYRLERDAFDQILQNRPEIAAGVSAVLAERKVQLEEVRAGLDAAGRTALRASERERILRNIRSFFGL